MVFLLKFRLKFSESHGPSDLRDCYLLSFGDVLLCTEREDESIFVGVVGRIRDAAGLFESPQSVKIKDRHQEKKMLKI